MGSASGRKLLRHPEGLIMAGQPDERQVTLHVAPNIRDERPSSAVSHAQSSW